MDQLRMMVCGSVDDGKSTLVGRFFHELGQIKADQVATIEKASRVRGGGAAGALNLAYFTDGLRSEVAQGITIDVAYRYLDMAGRRLVVADAPGHFEFTRNMVTACSQVDAVVLLMEAHSGVKEQTRRHLKIARWMKVPKVLVIVNKMDLCEFSEAVFQARQAEVEAEVGVAEITVIPACATEGYGILSYAETPLSWFQGPSLLDWLKRIPGSSVFGDARSPLRLSVQGAASAPGWVWGVVHSGIVAKEDGLQSDGTEGLVQVQEIQIGDESVDQAGPGDPVFLKLDQPTLPGMLLWTPEKGPQSAQKWRAEICLLLENQKVEGQAFWLRTLLSEKRVCVRAANEGGTIVQNEVQEVILEFDEAVALDTRDFAPTGEPGRFVLLAQDTGHTIAAGFLVGAL